MFQDGDVVAMIGDSITCDGRWWVELREQWLARHPAQFCDFRNCGIPGAGAGGALPRYDWDIAPLRPTVALVMFGMNDVWREGYKPPVTVEMLAGRDECLERYLLNMNELVERLIGQGIKVCLLTPTPFDQYASDRPAPNMPGVDDALAICAGMVKGIAVTRRLPVVDLHTPLRHRCAAGDMLISQDRVHPGEHGHMAMAELVCGALLPGAMVDVPPALREASRALHQAEAPLRILAMFRARAQSSLGAHDDDSLRSFLELNREKEPNPWVREQMIECRNLVARQVELEARVTSLREQLASAAGRSLSTKTTRTTRTTTTDTAGFTFLT